MTIWTKDVIQQFHEGYEGSYAGDQVASEIIRRYRRYIGAKTLDAGAGSGALLKLIPQAIGIDLVSKHIRMLKGDISHMPFITNYFNTVFLTEVIEHLDDSTLDNCLNEIHRILDKRGILICSVPDNEKLKENLVFCPNCRKEFHKVGHVRSVNEWKIKQMLEEKGFVIIKIESLPLGFISQHPFLKIFWKFFFRLGYLQNHVLFAVGVKSENIHNCSSFSA